MKKILPSVFLLFFSFYLFPAVRITEVAPNESYDWVEIFVTTPTNLSGWQLYEGSKLVKTFPDLTPGTSEFVVITFDTSTVDETNATGDTNGNGYWDLYTTDTGLTATDNVIILKDSNSVIVDMVAFANWSGEWTPTLATSQEFEAGITTGQWTGPFDIVGFDGAGKDNNIELCCIISWDTAGSGLDAGDAVTRDENCTDTDNSGQANRDWYVTNEYQSKGSFTAITLDKNPPATITNLSALATGVSGVVQLTWTAPMEDGTFGGACSYYVVRYATYPLNTLQDFYEAEDYSEAKNWIPAVPGTEEIHNVSGLTDGVTYWFLIQAMDDAWHLGDISNTGVKAIPYSLDLTPPSPITDLNVILWSRVWVATLTWTAPGDDGTVGTATSYEIRYATFTVASLGGDTTLWWNLAKKVDEDMATIPSPSPAGSKEVIRVEGLPSGQNITFHIRSKDESGNQSDMDTGSEASVDIPAHVLISEFATRGPDSARDEFVELYNPGDSPQDVTNWKLEYAAASHSGWNVKETLGAASVGAKGFYLITSNYAYYSSSNTVPADHESSTYLGLADDGHIRIVDESGYMVDKVGYGNAVLPEGNSPAPKH